MKAIRTVWLFVLLASATMLAQGNPVPFINQPLVPTATAPGGPTFTLTVNGTGFVSASVINWNGAALTTTFVNNSQLTASVPGANIATAGTASVVVTSPTPGGGSSNAAFFTVSPPNSSLSFTNYYYSPPAGTLALVAADFNGDGKLDLAELSATNAVAIQLGNGDGSFQAPAYYPVGTVGTSNISVPLVVGDFNGDGKLDIVVPNGSATVSILLGNGDGTFQLQTSYATAGALNFLVAGDFNGDGKLDLAGSIGGVGLGLITVLLGNGDGTFQTHVEYSEPTGSCGVGGMTVGDYDGDGKLDIATLSFLSLGDDCIGGAELAIFLGNGDGTFQSPVTSSISSSDYQWMATADFNGDNKLDLAASLGGDSGSVYSFLGNGDGTFQQLNSYPVGVVPLVVVAAGDFNADGILDLLVGNAGSTGGAGTVSILFGNGDGSFQNALDFPTTLTPPPNRGTASMVIGDFNGDGLMDIAVLQDAITDIGEPVSLAILLQGSQPQLSSNPSTLSFTSPVGTTSPAQTITLANTGTGAMTLSSIGIVGADPGDFSQTSTCPVGSSLAAGSNCNIQVTFTPSAEGARSGVVTVSDNSPGSPHTTPLTGVGMGPLVSLSPSNINFGNQTVGVAGFGGAVLTNTGNSSLSVTAINVTGSNSSDFAETNTCGTPIAAGNNCSVNLTFTPSAIGVRTATVSITDNAPGSPHLLQVSGVGVQGVTLSSTSVSFPAQYVGTSGLPVTVTLTNTGTTALAITSVVASPADFGALSACGGNVEAGASCEIGVFFDPATSGTRTGTLTITDSAINSPQTVALSGAGQDFSMSSSGQTTATVSPGQTATYTLSVAPGGGFNQTVAMSCSGAPAQSTCSLSSSSVALNGSKAATVTVTVTTAGSSAGFTQPFGDPPYGGTLAWLAFSGTLGLAMLLSLAKGLRARRPQILFGLAFLCLLSIGVTLSACGGSNSSGGGGGGTPAGNYNLAVTGTFSTGSTTLTHTTKLTLVVQ